MSEREILSRWLAGQLGFNLFYDSSFSPTWGNIIDALRNYGESQLAAKLEAKYCPKIIAALSFRLVLGRRKRRVW